MQTRRVDALKRLEGLAKELTKSQEVSSERPLEKGLGQTRASGNTDEAKSWLPEINEWIEDINSKVRNR